ncbi:MAG: helix-turn-helix domain-containing protein [Pseudonocardiaceae bacterium]|nr:helix-turn-helix domain-containing protein [Pseudonocardiaceae bacterium]
MLRASRPRWRACRCRSRLGWLRAAARPSRAPWSRRHLGERFRREYGLTPKQIARVMRFRDGEPAAARHRPSGLAELAARCGYYDQAHLTREWREFAGCPPTTWLAEELPSVQDSEPAQPRR